MTLPKIEDWKAPWEVDLKEGDDPKEKLDLDKLKRFVHGVLGDKEKAKGEVEAVTAARDELQAKIDEAARANETEADRLKRENEELKAKAAKADEPDLEKLKLKVAYEKKLTPTQMKRLVGATEEELAADADELLKEWTPAPKEVDEDEDGGAGPSVQPKSSLQNPGDPDPGKGKWDAEAAADDYMKRHGGLL